MTDQATQLRKLVEDKTEYETPEAESLSNETEQSEAGQKSEDSEDIEQEMEQGQKDADSGDSSEDNKTRVIAITSGKGGVGKTNLTVNLAIALGMAGQRVLVIDADLGTANVDVVLGSMSRKHLLNLLEDDTELSDVLIHGPYGVNYISGGSGIEKAKTFTRAQRHVLMRKLAECGRLADIILVDTGAGLGKNVMDFILAADEVLLVTTPEPTALTDAYAVMKAYSMYSKKKKLKLVVNRIYDVNESREVTEKLEKTSKKFLNMPLKCLGYIFEDRSVMVAVRNQKPFYAVQPNSLASKCIQAMVDNLLYGKEKVVKQGWRGFLRQIFNFS